MRAIAVRFPVSKVPKTAIDLLPSDLGVVPPKTLGDLQVGILQVKGGRVAVHVGALHFVAAPRVSHAVPWRHVLTAQVVVLFAKAITTSAIGSLLSKHHLFSIVEEENPPCSQVGSQYIPRDLRALH